MNQHSHSPPQHGTTARGFHARPSSVLKRAHRDSRSGRVVLMLTAMTIFVMSENLASGRHAAAAPGLGAVAHHRPRHRAPPRWMPEADLDPHKSIPSKRRTTDDLKTLPLPEVEKKLGSSPDGLAPAEARGA